MIGVECIVLNLKAIKDDDWNNRDLREIEAGFDGDKTHVNYENWWRFGRCVEIQSLYDLLENHHYCVANLSIDDTIFLGPHCLDGVSLTTMRVRWTHVGQEQGVVRTMPEVRFLQDALSSITRPDWPSVGPNDTVNLYLAITQYADGYSKFNYSQYQHSPVGAYTSIITDHGFGHTAISLSMLGDNSSRRILWNQFCSDLWRFIQGVTIQVMHPIHKTMINATLYVTMGISMFDSPEVLKMGMISRVEQWHMDRLSSRMRCRQMWVWPREARSCLDYKVHIRDEVFLPLSLYSK